MYLFLYFLYRMLNFFYILNTTFLTPFLFYFLYWKPHLFCIYFLTFFLLRHTPKSFISSFLLFFLPPLSSSIKIRLQRVVETRYGIISTAIPWNCVMETLVIRRNARESCNRKLLKEVLSTRIVASSKVVWNFV